MKINYEVRRGQRLSSHFVVILAAIWIYLLSANKMPKEDVEWFYNEVTVPEEGDFPSSYYMACGFGEGYFGMQNNSPHQRKILFSVWSSFNTDNPADIPDSLRVTLVKKGANTVIKEFGNEGSGGQGFMYYDWKPGERCRFLMGARPDGKGNTVYTAYFFDNNKGEWVLVASFRRPKTSTWYTVVPRELQPRAGLSQPQGILYEPMGAYCRWPLGAPEEGTIYV